MNKIEATAGKTIKKIKVRHKTKNPALRFHSEAKFNKCINHLIAIMYIK